tara:strand:- start:271 stop:561 length:291 start_codon:yes stop_codon:yes gene_type:complete
MVNKNNLTKKDLARTLSQKIGFSTNLSKKLIDDLIFILLQKIKTKKINLKNIGTFKLIKKKERLGRNPKTKEPFTISARKSVSFIPSKKLSNSINE